MPPRMTQNDPKNPSCKSRRQIPQKPFFLIEKKMVSAGFACGICMRDFKRFHEVTPLPPLPWRLPPRSDPAAFGHISSPNREISTKFKYSIDNDIENV